MLVCAHRYIDMPIRHGRPMRSGNGGLSPENFPVQHWLDNSRNRNNTAGNRPASPSSILRAAATAFEYNPSAAVPPPVAVSPGDAITEEPVPATGTPTHFDHLATWRNMSWPVDPLESGGQPEPRRRFGGHGNENGGENSGRGAGRRRVQARSASRGGRPQSSTDARRAGGGLVVGVTGVGDSGTGGWNPEGDGGVAYLPFSSMHGAPPAGHGNSGGGGFGGSNSNPSEAPGQYWHDMHRAHAEALLGGNPANLPGWGGRGLPSGERQHHETAVDERPRVVERNGNGSPRRGTASVQPHRGRRSLSDFLREIEEMVRAQREEVRLRTRALPGQPSLFALCFCFVDRSGAHRYLLLLIHETMVRKLYRGQRC